MPYELRRPEFLVSIVRPNYLASGGYSEEVVRTFDASPTNRLLVGYSFRQDLGDFESPFSLSFTAEPLSSGGDTVMELVRALDIVKIEEHGELKYLGVVSARRYSGVMTDAGPDRSITVSGYGLGGVLGRFDMLLDYIILADSKTTVSGLREELQAMIATLSGTHGEGASMTAVFEKIRSSFKAAMEKIGGFTSGTGIFKLLEKYLAFSSDSNSLRTKYPLALSAFSYGSNTLLSIWQSLVYRPFYEFFIRWDEAANRYLLHLRPTPFDPEAWTRLRRTSVNPLHVTAVDLGYSDAEAKTWFFSYLAGGALTYEEARYIPQAQAIEKDPLKWSLYGYRALECAFKYVDYDGLKSASGNVTLGPSTVAGDVAKDGGTISDADLMGRYTKKLKAWFSRVDEMASGSLTAMTMPKGPRIGERLTYGEVEFYVEAIDGSWMYGAEMQSRYSITRGGLYNPGFKVGEAESAENWWWCPVKRIASKGGEL